jgi:hypothetical protein
MLINESNRNKWLKELVDFKEKLSAYQAVVRPLAPEWVTLISEKLSRKLRTLQDELQVMYGGLKEVIKEHSDCDSVSHIDEQHDVFALALSDLSFENYKPSERTLEALGRAILLVNQIIGKIKAELKSEQLTSESIYPSGKPYDAYKHIKGIIASAAKKLTIIDPYVDGTLFTLLENVQSSVQIQILTQSMKGDFKLTGQKFKDQREKALQGKLEVRKSGKFHDRFIVVDDRFFHLGASIKDAGNKMCAMNEFEGADIKVTLRGMISTYWDEAEVVL